MGFQFIKIPFTFSKAELWVDKHLITHWHKIDNKNINKDTSKDSNECLQVFLKDEFPTSIFKYKNIIVPTQFITCEKDPDANFAYNRIKSLSTLYVKKLE